MRVAIVASLIFLTAVAAQVSSARTDSCEWGAVPSAVGCLVDGHACRQEHAAAYRRNGFACRAGFLRFDWNVLRRRPLDGPELAPGAPCPVSARTGGLTMFGLGGIAAWGPGPAWPVLGGVPSIDAVPFEFANAGPEYAEWGVRKAMWAIDPRYVGPTLVRGRQLDGPNAVRFENGSPGFTEAQRLNPPFELRFVGGYVRPAVTRVRALGCYAYQADGIGFSRQIVFRAVAG